VEYEQDSTGISRGLNQLYVLPEDWHAAAGVIEPQLDRVDKGTASAQLLVVTSDVEAAAAIAERIGTAVAQRSLRVIAATDSRRANRVLRSAPAQVVVGPPGVLVELLESTVLKLDAVRVVVLAWVDELTEASTRALETLVSEAPKDAARLIVATAVTPAVEQLVERYARRARRIQAASAELGAVAPLSYVTASPATRGETLRRVLDALDPLSAYVVTTRADSMAAVETQLRSLGYGEDSSVVRAGDNPEARAQLVVLFDFPSTDAELRKLVGERADARVVAIVTPRQLPALKRFAGGAVSPFVLPEPAVRARARETALRDELRAVLATGQYSRELLALEPLLSDYDGVELAAAALRLLEAERAKPQAASIAATPPASQPALTRLYLNVGSTDNVKPGDLVGAITNEAGISKAELGRVDVRDRHSTVEVATAVANSVVSKMTGVSIRGRRVVARVDEEREHREQREQRDRPPRPRRDDVRRGSRERPPKR